MYLTLHILLPFIIKQADGGLDVRDCILGGVSEFVGEVFVSRKLLTSR